MDSNALNEQDKANYRRLLDDHMTEAILGDSLRVLSELLEKHHGTKVVLLIDEYDVPLAKAYANGYYDQMISLIRSLLGEALKTNDSLKLALRKTISIRDTAVRTDMKENLPTGRATTKETKGQSPGVCFYHGVLLGILGVKNRRGISSNREMGEGYADVLAEPDTGDMGIIIEVKYAHDGDLDAACKEA